MLWKRRKWKKVENYDYKPTWSPTEMAAYRHDLEYKKAGADGVMDALLCLRVLSADIKLVKDCDKIMNNKSFSYNERMRAAIIGAAFTDIVGFKSVIKGCIP